MPRIGGNPAGMSFTTTSWNSYKRASMALGKTLPLELVKRVASWYQSKIIGCFVKKALLTSLALVKKFFCDRSSLSSSLILSFFFHLSFSFTSLSVFVLSLSFSFAYLLFWTLSLCFTLSCCNLSWSSWTCFEVNGTRVIARLLWTKEYLLV